jgi:hypothetical protein
VDEDVDVDVYADGGVSFAAAAEREKGRGWDLERVAEDRAVFREFIGGQCSSLDLAC